ncbi:LysR family transcriptional regulator [Roseomonas marmotae]|uniref:LysR family transcriptional regulator n=1 Tax=Roseomonas marmotae TaxID=2768161 RepID=A0ABS3K7P5_9PROT|nr:LysR family transcriptional regulator [Roseomonas marmotae]MBO1073482.1 LysR family transcriptional regulator [Roseomonas marmotae]QTI80326.1 LysR family transcriptional regulator [Roseomonas marmotae]
MHPDRRLDPVSLRLFRAAVDERSLAQAAERECIALSAASRRIAELEARLGTVLLRRHDRGVTPTAAGEALMTHLGTLFDLFDRIGADMDAFASGARGHVRLQVNMSAVSGFLPEALAGFMPAHPRIRLTLEERYSEEIRHAVQTGVADIGLLSGTVPTPGLHRLPWREDRLMVVLPEEHPLLAREALTIADLDGVPFVGQPAETALQKLYRQRAAAAGIELNERVNVSGFDGVRRMVQAGLGLAILPATAALPYAAAMRLALRPLAEDWAERPLVLCTRDPRTLSAAARLLVAHLTRPAPG